MCFGKKIILEKKTNEKKVTPNMGGGHSRLHGQHLLKGRHPRGGQNPEGGGGLLGRGEQASQTLPNALLRRRLREMRSYGGLRVWFRNNREIVNKFSFRSIQHK